MKTNRKLSLMRDLVNCACALQNKLLSFSAYNDDGFVFAIIVVRKDMREAMLNVMGIFTETLLSDVFDFDEPKHSLESDKFLTACISEFTRLTKMLLTPYKIMGGLLCIPEQLKKPN